MAVKCQTLVTALGISLLFSASMLSAAPGHQSGHNKFMKFFDTNGDGTVTHEEFLQASKSRFERMDTDSDGIVTEQEFRGYMHHRRKERHQHRMKKMDTDNNGTVSRDEFLLASQERAQRKFARMDRNGDGLLSSEEMSKSKHHKRHFGKKVFSKLDSDNNKQISREESQSAWDKWFQRMDSNGDQVVTREEVAQARSRWAADK